MTIGIVGYGAYVPRLRITGRDIAQAWSTDWEKILASLAVHEKSVPSCDEDTTTIAVAAALNALLRAGVTPEKITSILIGSESHAYAVKPTATMVAQALGINKLSSAADLEFACKAGTAALLGAYASVGAGMARYALAIGADTAQAAPGDVLEYTAAAGGAAFVVARQEAPVALQAVVRDDFLRNAQEIPHHEREQECVLGGHLYEQECHTAVRPEERARECECLEGLSERHIIKPLLAVIEHTCSITTDTPDFWRRPTEIYPAHTGRFTAEPAYFYHVTTVVQALLQQVGLQPSDIDHVVFHQPNARFPGVAAKRLGFARDALTHGLLAGKIGNTYSAATLLGLTAVLDHALSDQRILVVSYGSGSGADALLLRTTPHLLERRAQAPTTADYLERKAYVTYHEYRRIMDIVHGGGKS